MNISFEDVIRANRRMMKENEVISSDDSNLTESSGGVNKLTLDDLMSYPYMFTKVWRGAANSTFGDDFLELAETHNCIQLYGPTGSGVNMHPHRFFICKDKAAYASLKDALSAHKVLNNFLTVTPLREIKWDEIVSVTDKMYVDRYAGGYTVKFPKKR